MKLYAASTPHRVRQVFGDVLLLVWVLICIRIGSAVYDATLKLAAPGEGIASAGDSLASHLREAGETVGDVPLVGEQVRPPFDSAGQAADSLANAGQTQVDVVHDLATWLGVAIALIPILIVLAFYVPLRLRFILEATAGQRFIDATEDLDLFALRAMTRQPMHRLARISDDPAGAWRRRETDVIRRLAELELKDTGLALPRLPA
ncbi:MAG TPA: hypothetical protein VH419_12285 [Nocardioidaceae bacterium]|jgi:hypothetical protein